MVQGIDSREKRYVKVTSVTDEDGFITPVSVTWEDGRVYEIDRILDRRVDFSKVMHATGLDPKRFKSCRDAIADELVILSERPDLVARFDNPTRRELDAKMDAYFASHPQA